MTDIDIEAIRNRMSRLNVNGIKGQEADYHTLLYHDIPALISHIAVQDVAHEARELALIEFSGRYRFTGMSFRDVLAAFNRAYLAQKEKKDV